MLKIQNLHAKFEETPILKGVNLTINPGEIHVILGPNGSGKSTLGRVILGDKKFQKTNGTILFEKKDFELLSIPERVNAGFFLSFQSPPELSGVSVHEFLFAAKKAAYPNFTSSFRFKKDLEASLTSFRLPTHFAKRETNVGFSGGERKKIEMVSLEILNPKLAFLDEIDSGVDIDTIKKTGESIKKFLKDKTKSLIIVTHSEKLLQEITPTHVHIFCNGKIIRSGGQEIIERVHKNGFDVFVEKLKSKGFQVIKN
ncbi:Fe-S cluster assembly ATPase SufC [Candidatus Gracilibacteria bacterium]|nr:Fe-S cluster assembly ATPase SufC [Candidatus Gracilibacteria bacterium]